MPAIDRTRASFRIIGETLDPADVTNKLGLSPTTSQRRGDEMMGVPLATRRTGSWLVESPLPDTTSLEQHLGHLLDMLDARAAEIHEFKSMGYRVDFFCGCFMEGDLGGVGLSAETLQRIAMVGAALELDIYCFEEDDSEFTGIR